MKISMIILDIVGVIALIVSFIIFPITADRLCKQIIAVLMLLFNNLDTFIE